MTSMRMVSSAADYLPCINVHHRCCLWLRGFLIHSSRFCGQLPEGPSAPHVDRSVRSVGGESVCLERWGQPGAVHQLERQGTQQRRRGGEDEESLMIRGGVVQHRQDFNLHCHPKQEHCVAMTHSPLVSGRWNDDACHKEQSFVCFRMKCK